MCKPSPAGSRGAEAGFTLLELLVVLVIVGLIAAATPTVLSAALPGYRSKVAARTLADNLRMLRNQAVIGVTVTELVVNSETDDYSVRGLQHLQPLPAGLKLTACCVSPTGSGGDREVHIRFFPDGSSNGGTLTIGYAGSPQHRVSVDWLTGRIAIDG